MIKLLVVDDSALMRKLLGGIFAAEGDFDVAFARNGAEALAELTRFAPDVVTLDIHMPVMDGLECLDRIMVVRPCPVVMVSALTDEGAEFTLDALQLGAIDFIAKPSGAVSLEIDRLAPLIVRKVRAAARARIRPTARLLERVRMRAAQAADASSQSRNATRAEMRPVPPRRVPVAGTAKTGGGLVLVGTSTGGPPALDALLSALPADFRWPIVVAQHMPGTFTGPLAKRLDRLCALNVQEVVRPMPVQAGNVYVGRGDADVIVSARPGGLVVTAAPAHPDYLWHPSVDRLVASALDHVEPTRIVGVLMTGMGRDGAETMTLLRSRGGRTIAEAEETAVVWGMPGELVRAGGADVVAPLDRIAHELMGMMPAWP